MTEDNMALLTSRQAATAAVIENARKRGYPLQEIHVFERKFGDDMKQMAACIRDPTQIEEEADFLIVATSVPFRPTGD